MINELGGFVGRNWYIIPPIILGAYGLYQMGSGILHEIRRGNNAGLVEIVRGVGIATAGGMGVPLSYKLAEYLQR